MYLRTITLPGVRACTLLDCLAALAEEIGRHCGPHRPLPYPLIARRIDTPTLHLGIDATDAQLTALYSQEPCPAVPQGILALGVVVKPHMGCGSACAGKCTGDLEVGIWQAPTLPFSAEEVDGFIGRFYRLTDQALVRFEDPWLRALHAYLQGETPNPRKYLATGRQRRRPGAPVQGCTEWLLEQIRMLANPREHKHLAEEWLRLHWQETGEELADKTRSFQKAAERCVRIVEIERARAQCGAERKQTVNIRTFQGC